MTFRLIPDWRRVLKRAWSIRLTLVAGAFAGLEVFLPLIDGYWDIPPGRFAALSGLTSAATLVSRLLAQASITEQPK